MTYTLTFCVTSLFVQLISNNEDVVLIWSNFRSRGSYTLKSLLVLRKWGYRGMCSDSRVISIWPSQNYSCVTGWTKGKSDLICSFRYCFFSSEVWTLTYKLMMSLAWFCITLVRSLVIFVFTLEHSQWFVVVTSLIIWIYHFWSCLKLNVLFSKV